MHHLISFFFHRTGEMEAFIFSGLLLACWNIENLAALAVDYRKWNHAFLNAKFIVTGTIPQFIMGMFFVKTMQWTGLHQFGLLYQLHCMKHPIILFIVSFILLDFGEYLYHVIMHKIKRLWMFHAVHHSDNIVDVSTTLREHPAENLIRNSFTLLWVLFSGTIFWILLLRQLIQIASNLAAHMNCRLPDKLDAVLGVLFITPNLHQVHHHYQRPYTDCNYGDVLSIWDRLFGTFCRLPYKDIVFGVDMYMDKKVNSEYISLIKLPFGKYKTKKDCI